MKIDAQLRGSPSLSLDLVRSFLAGVQLPQSFAIDLWRVGAVICFEIENTVTHDIIAGGTIDPTL